ncbi:MAG: hypothetical protein KKB50_17210 [Planctomycetes bacterium]|nr:hypothetical protein [Planctomycetota bacterium]
MTATWQPAVATRKRVDVDVLLAAGRRLDPSDPATIRHAASKLASELFFAPLLAEMRKLPFGREYGQGGRTEEVFGEHLDRQMADAVAAADCAGLTTQLATRLQGGRPAREMGGNTTMVRE